jgi:glycosyltransferase involved in cell wall biosynthesis
MNKNQDGQTDSKLSNSRLLLSIIVPAFIEEEVLPEFHNRISGVLESISMDAEIVYVNDGSTDTTLDILEEL